MNKWLKIYCVIIFLILCGFIGLLIYAVNMNIQEMADIAICGVIISYMFMMPIKLYYELKCIINDTKRENNNE